MQKEIKKCYEEGKIKKRKKEETSARLRLDRDNRKKDEKRGNSFNS